MLHRITIFPQNAHIAASDGSNLLDVLAFDIGTTSVVGHLLDSATGKTLASESCLNPQYAYGADVISRIRYAVKTSHAPLTDEIRHGQSRANLDKFFTGNMDAPLTDQGLL